MRVTVFLIALALAACGRATTYPAEYRTAFMQTCQGNGSSEQLCACVWDHIEAEVPRAEFEAADRALQSGQPHPMSARVLGFADQCRATP